MFDGHFLASKPKEKTLRLESGDNYTRRDRRGQKYLHFSFPSYPKQKFCFFWNWVRVTHSGEPFTTLRRHEKLCTFLFFNSSLASWVESFTNPHTFNQLPSTSITAFHPQIVHNLLAGLVEPCLGPPLLLAVITESGRSDVVPWDDWADSEGSPAGSHLWSGRGGGGRMSRDRRCRSWRPGMKVRGFCDGGTASCWPCCDSTQGSHSTPDSSSRRTQPWSSCWSSSPCCIWSPWPCSSSPRWRRWVTIRTIISTIASP